MHRSLGDGRDITRNHEDLRDEGPLFVLKPSAWPGQVLFDYPRVRSSALVGEDGIVEEGQPFVHRAVTRDDRGGPPMAPGVPEAGEKGPERSRGPRAYLG